MTKLACQNYGCKNIFEQDMDWRRKNDDILCPACKQPYKGEDVKEPLKEPEYTPKHNPFKNKEQIKVIGKNEKQKMYSDYLKEKIRNDKDYAQYSSLKKILDK